MTSALENTCIVTKIRIRPEAKISFVDWQAKFNAAIAAFQGFVSLEILSPTDATQLEWTFVERLCDPQVLSAWRKSEIRRGLFKELTSLLPNDASGGIREVQSDAFDQHGCVTEVFVTEVSPDKEVSYRQWIAKIHQVEAKFPGFRGVYVQSPSQGQGKNWITLLQFDTPENLDRWLSSPERREVLEESNPLVAALESHRVISPYAGWFSSITKEGRAAPSVWKQTMIILLVLFPIVMLEFKFLNPHTAGLNLSLATFIGNAISVSLVSWPMMPIAIWFLGWWLSPDEDKRQRANIVGTFVVLALYLIEIIVFWNLI